MDLDLYDILRRRAFQPKPYEDPFAAVNPLLSRRMETTGRIEEALAAGAGSVGLLTRKNAAAPAAGHHPGDGHNHGGGSAKPNGSNGRLDPSQLVSIGGGHRLVPKAAAAWNRMVADARKQGVNISITDSYRSYDAQVAVAKKKGLYSQGGLAATPGKSNHGWGLAVDVGSGREWLAKNGSRYGFKTIPREPWHWEYKG